MTKIVDKLLKFTLKNLDLYKHIHNKLTFPKLNADPSVRFSVDGDFIYGNDCNINMFSNIIIAKNTTLKLGNNCYIGRLVELGPGSTIEIGDYTSLQDRCIFVGDVKVGRYCLFSLNVLISSGRHQFDRFPHLLIRDQDEISSATEPSQELSNKNQVVIEDDCWIGVNVVIMPGVRVGKGAVIGANSVVTKDVFPYCVVAGAPAVFFKNRLAFNPPREICYENLQDHPYFYSGIEISQEERKLAKPFDGLVTHNTFQLALDTKAAKTLYLRVKSTNGIHQLSHQEHQAEVGEHFTDIAFTISPEQPNRLELKCRNEVLGSKLILQKAWVQ